jgi:hypothetical protein
MTPDLSTLLVSIEQLQRGQQFTELIQQFLGSYMELEVPQILPALSFIARYFGLDSSTQDFPIVIKQNRKTVSSSSFQ